MKFRSIAGLASKLAANKPTQWFPPLHGKYQFYSNGKEEVPHPIFPDNNSLVVTIRDRILVYSEYPRTNEFSSDTCLAPLTPEMLGCIRIRFGCLSTSFKLCDRDNVVTTLDGNAHISQHSTLLNPLYMTHA